MKLELALVLTCDKTGCRVARLKDNVHIEACYSSLVQDRIMIQPDQLVAIDTGINPPEIVWRWVRTAVIELAADSIVLVDKQCHPAEVTLVSEMPLTLNIDDEVWVCSTGGDYEIHDVIVDGKPTHPNRMLRYIAPIIEEIYRQ